MKLFCFYTYFSLDYFLFYANFNDLIFFSEPLDLNIFFSVIHQRLRNPEWEVRQHALRVLSDFIPLIESSILEVNMDSILNDLVTNLGHIGPAVRKAAVDCLRTYLLHTSEADLILKNLVKKGVEHAHENKVHVNVVVGIILALPFLLSIKSQKETIAYLIHVLLDKLVQVTHQETVMRSLFRMRELIGTNKFDKELATHGETMKQDFKMLCDVYNLHGLEDSEGQLEKESKLIKDECVDGEKNGWNDYNHNLLGTENEWNRSESDLEGSRDEVVGIIEDKVILETEIKLNSGSAITMKIHEESRQSSITTDSEDDIR